MAVLKISMVTTEEAGDYTVVSENRFGKVCFKSCENLAVNILLKTIDHFT